MKRQVKIALVLAGAAYFSNLNLTTSFASGDYARLCEIEFKRSSIKYGVPLGMLYSVGLAETGRKGSLHPFALNIEGKAVFPNNKAMALMEIQNALTEGKKLIDIGCMQINYYYHKEHFKSTSDMIDPRRNVEYAAKFLSDLKLRHDTWTMAIARYHAGPKNNPAHKRYVCRVIANMVASGFGNWTSEARSLCGYVKF